jgi:hypothetical protein
MELTQQVRDYAAAHDLEGDAALRAGLEEKAVEFRRKGDIYVRP